MRGASGHTEDKSDSDDGPELKLEMLDETALEASLAVTNMVSKIRTSSHDELFALDKRMAVVLGQKEKLAEDDKVTATTGAEVGFAGPVGLDENVRLLADLTLQGRTNLLTGCNETGYHCLNVNFGRDCREPEFAGPFAGGGVASGPRLCDP